MEDKLASVREVNGMKDLQILRNNKYKHLLRNMYEKVYQGFEEGNMQKMVNICTETSKLICKHNLDFNGYQYNFYLQDQANKSLEGTYSCSNQKQSSVVSED